MDVIEEGDIYTTELANKELSITPRSTAEDTLQELIGLYQQKHISIPVDMFNGVLKNPPGEITKVNERVLDTAIMYLVLLLHSKKIQKSDGTVKCSIRYLMGFLHWGQRRVREAIKDLEHREIIKYEALDNPQRPNIRIIA